MTVFHTEPLKTQTNTLESVAAVIFYAPAEAVVALALVIMSPFVRTASLS
ncbi:MAG: hypothetical protein IPG42_18615 [Betaproteobacteria bacterium]|jgi:hypothetical protein|nr:hypothetical protein [Betaproteobacteria bacterium]